MAWEKIVQLVAVGACPRCDNRGFDFEPGANMDDPAAMVRCGACGYVCPASEFVRAVEQPKDNNPQA